MNRSLLENATTLSGNAPPAKQQSQKECNGCMQPVENVTKPLVVEEDIIKTYSNADQFSCQKYAEYLDLLRYNPTMGYKNAAKLLGISTGSTRWWHTQGPKRSVPLPLKAIAKLKTVGLLPFDENHPEAEDIFRILGTVFGDGNIDRNLNTMSFISSNLEDVENWKNNLIRIFPFAKNKMNMIEGGEYGDSFCMRTFDRSVIRFFVALGAPVGDKVATVYSLSNSICSSSKESKLAFLDGFFSSEIAVPQFKQDKRSKSTIYWKNLQLGLSKIDQFETEHRAFLKSVQKLAEEVGTTCTPHIRKDFQKPSFRKDGHTSYCYRIFFQTHFDKVLLFNQQFPLKFCADKKRRFDHEVENAVEYRKNLNFQPKPI